MSRPPFSSHAARTDDRYESGPLVGPPAEVVANALALEVHDDDVADLVMAMVGWDQAIQALAASDDPRAGQVMLSLLSWLLLA